MNLKDKTLIFDTLKRVEWGVWVEGHQTCPICNSAYKYGHEPKCELIESLKLVANLDVDNK